MNFKWLIYVRFRIVRSELGEEKVKYRRTHLFAGVEALGLRADLCSHVTRNVWPDNGENDDDEEEDDAGGA